MTLRFVIAKTMLLIKCDGSEQVIAFDRKTYLGKIRELIDAKSLDFVRIGKLENLDLVMAIDDLGYETETIEHGGNRFELKPVRALKPINPKATELYHAICYTGTTHQIVGDVVILHDGEA
jgi:hypothetical protein